MTGKTHIAIGLASSTVVLATGDVKTVIAGLALAVAGSIMPDIDVKGSQARRVLKETVISTIVIAIINFFMQKQFNISLVRYLTDHTSVITMAPAIATLVVAVLIGIKSPHRGITHSAVGVGMFCIPMFMLFGTKASWFLVGYVMHLVADILNKKGEVLLYPIPKRFCLNVMKADGIGNHLLALTGYIIFLIALTPIIVNFK